jgi:hypothetical protein
MTKTHETCLPWAAIALTLNKPDVATIFEGLQIEKSGRSTGDGLQGVVASGVLRAADVRP